MITLVENIALPAVDDGRILKESIRAALDNEKLEQDVDLSLVIEDDQVLTELNKQYRGIDATTDVLSFQADEVDPASGITYIGDIIISLDQAQRQAEKSNHLLISELQLLAVHGTLHLLGYDHAEEDEKKKMWEIQKKILTSIGVNLAVWPEE